MADTLLTVNDLQKYFPVRGGLLFKKLGDIKAVDGVSFSVNVGETLGLVGESGCGKSTLARLLVRLLEPTFGSVVFDGKDVSGLKGESLRQWRQKIQMIFQDPYDSLNARHTVGQIVREPLEIHSVGQRREQDQQVAALLKQVGLPESAADRFPHEFSGGQRQRIGIARALALKPAMIICDEPVSALDVSIQSQILNLLVDLQKRFNIAMVFVAHDLAAVKFVSDRIAVMYLGKIVEIAEADSLYSKPMHPYTQGLMRAIPNVENRKVKRATIEGDIPSPFNPPSGCRFHSRCPHKMPRCTLEEPKLRAVSSPDSTFAHQVACHLVEGG